MAVPLTAFVFMLSLLSAASVVMMTIRENQREAERTPVPPSERSPSDLFMYEFSDSWLGKSINVEWIEPASDAKPVLPPGVSELPRPGRAVVSPELARRISENPELARRYPASLIVGTDGLRSADELLAYVRVQEGRTLKGTYSMRVGEFGRSGANNLETEIPLYAVVEGVIAFLVVPGLIVLGVGVASASVLRDKRFETLHWIGVPARNLASLALIETLALALPGMLIGSTLWALLSPRLENVPFVGHSVIRGDMELSPILVVALLLIGIVAVSLVAIAMTIVSRLRESSQGRPGTRRVRIGIARWLPLAMAASLFVASEIVGNINGALFALGGMLFTVAAVPLMLPMVLRWAGAFFGRRDGLLPSIVGRIVEWNPVQVSRPFAGLSALLVISLTGSGYLALMNNMSASEMSRTDPVVAVDWLDPRAGDIENLSNSLDGYVVAPVRATMQTTSIGASCEQLQTSFPDEQCDPNRPFTMTPTMERKLGDILMIVGGSGEIHLKAKGSIPPKGTALVFGDDPLPVLESRVRTSAMQTVPAPAVYSYLTLRSLSSPLMPWISGGIVSAVLILGASSFVSLVDRMIGTRRKRQHLLNLGIRPRQLAAFEAIIFALPFAVVAFVSFVIGLLVCVLIVIGPISGVPIPWRQISLIAIISIVAGVAGTICVSAFGSRGLQRNSD